MDDFHDRHFNSMLREWTDRKNEIREILGTGPAMEGMDLDLPTSSVVPAFATPAAIKVVKKRRKKKDKEKK